MNKQSLEQWISQLDEEGYCDISDKQVEALIRGFAALEKQRDALAADNAAMKRNLKIIATSESLDGETVVCDFDTLVSVAAGALKTPATDGFLREVRAQGAEACVKALATSDDDDFTDAPNICACVAYQLRKGGAA